MHLEIKMYARHCYEEIQDTKVDDLLQFADGRSNRRESSSSLDSEEELCRSLLDRCNQTYLRQKSPRLAIAFAIIAEDESMAKWHLLKQ